MIPIGKFSAACQCSVKTLRYYDRIGLLVPARIDDKSGYRYYEADQLETMALINRFKRYGFTLDQISILLNGSKKDQRSLFGTQIQILRHQMEEMSRSVTDLEILLDYASNRSTDNKNAHESSDQIKENSVMKPLETYTIDLCTREQQPILAVRGRFGVGDFGAYFSKLFETAHKDQIPLSPVTGARYFDQEFDPANNDTEVFAFVSDPAKANAFLPGGQYVHTIHEGEYSRLSEAYAALTKWMDENGYAAAGAPWELYTTSSFSGKPVEEWKTDVYFPVVKA